MSHVSQAGGEPVLRREAADRNVQRLSREQHLNASDDVLGTVQRDIAPLGSGIRGCRTLDWRLRPERRSTEEEPHNDCRMTHGSLLIARDRGAAQAGCSARADGCWW